MKTSQSWRLLFSVFASRYRNAKYWFRTYIGKNSSWFLGMFLGMYMPMFMLKKHNRFSIATPMKFWPIFHAFYAHNHSNFKLSSCLVHAQFIHVHGMNWVRTKALILYFMPMNPILMRMKSCLYFMHINHC